MKDILKIQEPPLNSEDTKPHVPVEPIVISTKDKPRINKKAIAVGASIIVAGAVVVDRINTLKSHLNAGQLPPQTGMIPTDEPTLTPSPTRTPDYQSTIQTNIEIINDASTQNANLQTHVAQIETEVTPTSTPSPTMTASSSQISSGREISNPDMGETPVQESTFTFYQTRPDAVGDNEPEVNSVVRGGITTAEDQHVLDIKSATLASFVFNGTGSGLEPKDLQRLATSHAFLQTQFGVTGNINTGSLEVISDITAEGKIFTINGINFETNSDSLAKGKGVDANGEPIFVEIYQTISQSRYIDEVAVSDISGKAFVVSNSDVEAHGFMTFVIKDAEGNVITTLSIDKKCGNVVAQNHTMVFPTPGATVTPLNTPTPILFMSETPTPMTPYFTPSSTYTPPVVTETSTPIMTLTPTAQPTPTRVNTQPPPTQTEAPQPTRVDTQPAPTEIPPTDVPPTQIPPTEVHPTDVPPTSVPATEAEPTRVATQPEPTRPS